MHNDITRPTAIEKHLNSRHVENMISHYFLQTNHAPSFIRDTSWRVGELKYSRGKISLISNLLDWICKQIAYLVWKRIWYLWKYEIF